MPKNTKYITTSGNMAASKMAYAMSEIAAIYPITPSSDMAEHYDVLSNKGVKNIFGKTPVVSELQSEAGAAGALHGALAGGALATTFTASQGLLLMIPNMFKIAGELLPCTMHVSARTVATHALSIFGDHSDVMAVRSTGWAMLASSNVQEAQDMALVAHLASIKSSYPFLHFFDGFRTSHEVNKIESIEYPMIKTMVKELEIEKDVKKFYGRALDPRTPHQAGTAQNPDTYFQNREACNDILGSIPNIIHNILTSFDKHTGRKYSAFEYFGNQNAKHVTVCMASATDTIREYLDSAKNGNGHNGGLVKVRLYRPFDVRAFLSTLPKSVETITVLDRTKENGSVGEPLFVDVCAALLEGGRGNIKVIRGRYGLASKEFTVPMVHAVYENMCSKEPKNGFTIGINDDVSHTSLEYEGFKNTFTNNKDVVECKFFGLGSDGTVSANKNTATIINDETDKFAQVYFVYDSKKSGATTVSHMRFADKPINMPYLVTEPSFIACHNQSFLGKFDMLSGIKNGGTFLLNTTYSPSEIDTLLPDNIKRTIRDKSINLYIINAYKIATDVGLGKRINT
ncbi:MAG: 2-oxoacid:acceptor oxidoreductase family protein, partial [Firmicutes bacterium]|nr:2-oxoacid:acceptor oxidoreductase family protein [Bacillota bacterium]